MNKMTTRIAASAVTMLIAVSMIQSATAAERTKKHHAAATTSEQVRNANASVAPLYGYPAESGSFRDEALAPPAGH